MANATLPRPTTKFLGLDCSSCYAGYGKRNTAKIDNKVSRFVLFIVLRTLAVACAISFIFHTLKLPSHTISAEYGMLLSPRLISITTARLLTTLNPLSVDGSSQQHKIFHGYHIHSDNCHTTFKIHLQDSYVRHIFGMHQRMLCHYHWKWRL